MSNMTKAFKTKAKMGLRLAAGGLLDPRLAAGGREDPLQSEGSAVARLEGNGQLFDPNAPLSTGSRDLDTLGTAQGSAPQFALKSFSELPGNTTGPYKAGGVDDPKASGLSAGLMQQRQNLFGAAPRPTPVPQSQGFDLTPSRGLQALRDTPRRMADGGIVPLIQNRKAQIDAAANYDNAPAPAVPAPAAPASMGSEADNYAAQAAALERKAAADAQARQAAQKPKSIWSRIGLARGGVVQGPGTRTSDSVPASVGTGDDKQKLALSKGEGLLVVSNNTMDNPQAMEQIKQILADSNGGKEPTMPNQGLRGGVQRAADAAIIIPENVGSGPRPNVVPQAAPPAASPVEGLSVGTATPNDFADAQLAQQRAAINAAANGQAVGADSETLARAARSRATTPTAMPAQPVIAAAPAQVPTVNPIRAAMSEAGGMGNMNVGEAAGKGLRAAAPVLKTVVNNPVTRGVAKSVMPIAAAVDASDIADVATDPNMGKADVAAEVADKTGKWASGAAGAGLGAKAGAGLGAVLAPFTGGLSIPVGAAIGGVGGGIAGYMGADKIMRAGRPGDGSAPSENANGITSRFKRDVSERIGLRGNGASQPAAQPTPTAPVPVAQQVSQPAPIAAEPTAPVGGRGGPTVVDPKGEYDAHGNNMRWTNEMKRSLREMQQERFLSEATASNPAYHERGLAGLAAMLAQDKVSGENGAKMAEAQAKMAESQIRGAEYQRGLRKDARAESVDERNFQADQEKVIDGELKAWAGEDKDGARLAAGKAYVNNHFGYNPKEHPNPRTWTQQVLNNLRLEDSLSNIGSRLGTSERDFDGMSKSEWEYDPNMSSGDSLRPGTWGGGARFRNKRTKQVVSEGELKSLPEPLLNEFWRRVPNLPEGYNKQFR